MTEFGHQHRFHCIMQDEPAAMERLCQVVRVRGFRLEALAMGRDAGRLTLAFTATGQRSPAMLQSQLEKLISVESVTCAPPESARQTA
ncbi:acetolactate synthase small subunit [Tamilnaduibacter salinus]|uniref:Acetolactate synthase small subunit n=2 Tax=Tamilnaduibacter salinus TaxID=1484056 RepID=A0A2U1CVM7_9GAMM|nr:ACT domain-containing protein [Tamilnaduibacter salinus]PVY75784.1 acetolactate synthase small subunit [Tamilnaduibacter salinus]